jgi:hypothetical protein
VTETWARCSTVVETAEEIEEEAVPAVVAPDRA